jgi:hypothetical protein
MDVDDVESGAGRVKNESNPCLDQRGETENRQAHEHDLETIR